MRSPGGFFVWVEMPENAIHFAWTQAKAQSAIRLAADELSDAEIATEAGVHVRTLGRWKEHPTFRDRVADHVAEQVKAMHRLEIAKKHKRVAILDRLHGKALDVIEYRAQRYSTQLGDDPEVVALSDAKRVFGGSTPFEATTGLLVEKETVNNAGYRTTEWSFDAALVREIRALEDQAAEEMGQKVDRSEVQISGGLRREYVVIRDDEPTAPPVAEDVP